jgi:hypothetical protein
VELKEELLQNPCRKPGGAAPQQQRKPQSCDR